MDLQLSQKPPKCLICLRPANGYHYGVPSCKGCKTFFRRMCVSKSELSCQFTQKCYDSAEWGISNIRCQACRFQKCLEVGMNPYDLELNQVERKFLDAKLMTRTLASKDLLTNSIIQALTYLETKLESLRLSAYNPKYCNYGSLEEMIKCTSKISMAEKYGPMSGWPLPKVSPKEISTSTRIRDLPDSTPPFINDRKIWMLFNLFTSIEYTKTFSFFNELHEKDKIFLVGHTTLICMFLHDSYFSYSNKFDGNLQPDGSETPLKDESTYSIIKMSFGPLVRCQIRQEEYLFLKAICLCNPTIHGLSSHAQKILTEHKLKYASILFDICRKNGGASRFVELLGLIPVLEQQQHAYKNFHVTYIAPVLAKYAKTSEFINDIMFL